MMNTKIGDMIEVDVDKYAFEGKGIARVNRNSIIPDKSAESEQPNYVVFVDGSYPGDKVSARLTKIKNSYSEAKRVNIIKPSEFRVEPKCKYFGNCGGCKQQDLNYQTQVDFKQQQVREIFEKMGGLTDYICETILSSDKIFYYRNKMEFSFAERKWLPEAEFKANGGDTTNFALGLHLPGFFDRLLDIDECFLQSELSLKIVNFTRDLFKDSGVPVYTTKTHTGYLRNLVIKTSHHTDDIMVNLVTGTDNELVMKEYSAALLKQFPEITTIVNNVSLKKASIAVGDYERIYHGSGFITDSIGKYNFRISANSFFQTNTLQAEKLYQTVVDFAEFTGNEIVYDLFCGTGSIAIFISKFVKEVFGFESIETSIFDAKENTLANNVFNTKFINANLLESIAPALKKKRLPKPDVVILDPPRSGLHKNTIYDVMEMNPRKIIYVSCNPTTQVRDIRKFVDLGYDLVKIRPVDMFPHTFHIENVALLVK